MPQDPVTEDVTEQPAPAAELDGELGVLGVLGVLGELGEVGVVGVVGGVEGVELGDVGPDPGVVVYVTCVYAALQLLPHDEGREKWYT